MRQYMLMEKYPVFDLTIPREETSCASIDDVIARLRQKIEAHPKVAYIATFDHYAHTQGIGGDIDGSIKAAKNIVFCFGVAIPNAHILAVRPRSIGVADLGDAFHITFLEPPMELATKEMEVWCKSLADRV